MTEPVLKIENLKVSVQGKQILNGVNLAINKGEVHAIMGPNGSGKSTLANVLLGHPKYKVESGRVLYKGKNVLEMKPNERARLGLFLSFQHPFEISGLSFLTFLRAAYKARFPDKEVNMLEFQKMVNERTKQMGFNGDTIKREVNVGFSGGEKKRAEILQMLVLQPEFAILDETDSGLDIDSLKLVAQTADAMRSPEFSALVITHYKRILNYIKPDHVHVLVDGKIALSGDSTLADHLEEKGYSWVTEDKPAAQVKTA